MLQMQKCVKYIKRFKSTKLAFFIGVLILVLDVSSKNWIESNMSLGGATNVCSFFNIVRVHNYGVTFGMLYGMLTPIVISILSILVLSVLLYWGNKERYILPYAILVSFGALGNIHDRLIYGYVVDFLDFFWYGFHWPAFNIADCAIVFGNVNILLMILCDNNVQQ